MTPEQFAYWLQGFNETHDGPPTKEQWKVIREHLQTVFCKVTGERLEHKLKGASLIPWDSHTKIC